MEQATPPTAQFSKRPLIAIGLAGLSAACCLIPYAISLLSSGFLWTYYRNLPMTLLAEASLCIGAFAAVGGIITAGFALSKGDANRIVSIIAIPIGLFALLVIVLLMLFIPSMSIISQ